MLLMLALFMNNLSAKTFFDAGKQSFYLHFPFFIPKKIQFDDWAEKLSSISSLRYQGTIQRAPQRFSDT